jgi:tRNA (guanine-N7-)-methyltransferase
MSKGKLEKFAELKTFPNVFQNVNLQDPKLVDSSGAVAGFRGRWNELYFRREAPIVLELACGKGEYTIGLAKAFPERNYIGVDIKGNRIWKGAKYAYENGLANVAFVRTVIEQLPLFFGPGEVDEVWITFPDPYLKKSKARKRLTSPRFLDAYRQFLKLGGAVQLKTDSPQLFAYTLEVIATHQLPVERLVHDVYREASDDPVLTIKTFYEQMHLAEGRAIRYVRFRLG